MAVQMEDRLSTLEGDQDTLSNELDALQLRILNATLALNDYEQKHSAAIESNSLSMKTLLDVLPSVRRFESLNRC
jgi:hypothetical protein